MTLSLILQLLTLWRLCHTNSTMSASYPQPWLDARPASVVTPGINVTLTCRAPQPAWIFGLFKTGHIKPLFLREESVELAEFFLEEVTPVQGGSYHCCYGKTDWGPGVWSQPSDVLELLVTDHLPKPSLVALPGPVVAPGDNVSLRCAGRMRGMSFVLYRVDLPMPLQYFDSDQPWADFPLLGTQAPGTYTCYYHTPSAPYVLSQRSETLVISSQDSGSLDYTRENLIRLGMAGLVLVSLCLLVAFDWRSGSFAWGSSMQPGGTSCGYPEEVETACMGPEPPVQPI